MGGMVGADDEGSTAILFILVGGTAGVNPDDTCGRGGIPILEGIVGFIPIVVGGLTGIPVEGGGLNCIPVVGGILGLGGIFAPVGGIN